jgi:hypothetical protein
MELESTPIMSNRRKTPMKRNWSGRILFTQSSNPRHHPLPSPRRYPLPRAKLTAPGASSKTDAHFGAFILAGGSPETIDIDTKHGPNCLTDTSHHCCPPSSQGEQNRFATMPQCRRWKSHRKLRPKAPYMANSGEPLLRAGRTTVRSTALWPESPLAVRSPISAPD